MSSAPQKKPQSSYLRFFKGFLDLCEYPLNLAGFTLLGASLVLTGAHKTIKGNTGIITTIVDQKKEKNTSKIAEGIKVATNYVKNQLPLNEK